MTKPNRSTITVLLAVLAALPAAPALAFDFVPTPVEWAAWPWYCKGKYRDTDVYRTSEFNGTVPESLNLRTRNELGEAYPNIHHYCAGRSWVSRIRAARTNQERLHAVHQAVAETGFSIDRTPTTHWLYPEIAVTRAQAFFLGDDLQKAFDAINTAMRAAPDAPQLYSMMYLLLRKAGKEDQAFEVLQKGGERAAGRYAELEYFLGIEYLKRDDLENAKAHADKAYALGYPLPGLRDGLKAKGAW